MAKICTWVPDPTNSCTDDTIVAISVEFRGDFGIWVYDETTDMSTAALPDNVTAINPTVGGLADGFEIGEILNDFEICQTSVTNACEQVDTEEICTLYIPIPESKFGGPSFDASIGTTGGYAPDPNTGVVDLWIDNYKKFPSPAPACEPMRIQIFLEDGTLYEEISTLDSCTDINTWDTSLGGGSGNAASVLAHSVGGLQSWNFDKLGWATTTGYMYAADGSSILNGNQTITDLSNIEARTFAQELKLVTYVGGQGSTTCPTESTNPDNTAVICKPVLYYISGVDANTFTTGEVREADNIVFYEGIRSLEKNETLISTGETWFTWGGLPTTALTLKPSSTDQREQWSASWAAGPVDYENIIFHDQRRNGLFADGNWWQKDPTNPETGQINIRVKPHIQANQGACGAYEVDHRIGTYNFGVEESNATAAGYIDFNNGDLVTPLNFGATTDVTPYNYTYPGVGIYTNTAEMTLTSLWDGVVRSSKQTYKVELNYWY